jgi:hypothetical protein
VTIAPVIVGWGSLFLLVSGLLQSYRLVQQRFSRNKSKKPRQETRQQTRRHTPA